MPNIDIEKYAKLARIDLSKEELEKLEVDIENILEYVEQIQSFDTAPLYEGRGSREQDKEGDVGMEEKEAGRVRNVMREDGNPHEGGKYTAELLQEAPESEGEYIKVKRIL